MLKWWIDKSGNIYEVSKCKVPDDNYHNELANRLWGIDTETALNIGMVRVVLYKGKLKLDFRHSRTHKQKQACKRLSEDYETQSAANDPISYL